MWNHIGLIRIIKKYIPFEIRMNIIRVFVLLQTIWYLYLFPKHREWGSKKKIYVLLSTDYSNLGDHAITYAHIKMLKEQFPTYKIYEILVGDTIKYLKSIKNNCTSRDIITLKGGGNVGIQYFREELIRRKIIEFFPNNKIVMFPQTVYFPPTSLGKREFKKTINIFNSHNDFHAFFRDENSYRIMEKYLKCNKYLVPDMVFYLKKLDNYSIHRHGAVTCLRDDVEGIYSQTDKQIVFRVLNKVFGSDVIITDTIRTYKISINKREDELISMWKTIANAKVVVTDRLHGMIFAALTGTPCIVLDTYNHKLHGQYKWISNLNYIYCLDLDEEKIKSVLNKILLLNVEKIENEYFLGYFMKIINVLKGKEYEESTECNW